MSSTFVVSNVPAETTPDELLAHWAKTGAPILSIEPIEGGDPDNLAFKVEIDVDGENPQDDGRSVRGSWSRDDSCAASFRPTRVKTGTRVGVERDQ